MKSNKAKSNFFFPISLPAIKILRSYAYLFILC